MTHENPDTETYSTQWRSPVKTNGEWRDVVVRDTESLAREALNDKIKARLHCRIIVHRVGQEDVTLEEYGPFNTSASANTRHDWT